jgi:hypothetical protein
MAIYAIGVMPLIQKLESSDKSHHQIWFADDAASTGSFDALREWLAKLVKLGPSYGYFVNPKKTWLIVKDETKLEEVKALFHGTGINVTSDAKKHLGAWLGDKSSVIDHLKTKIDEWINTILFNFRSCQIKTTCCMHILLSPMRLLVYGCTKCALHLMSPLFCNHYTEDAMRIKFLPSLLGRLVI